MAKPACFYAGVMRCGQSQSNIKVREYKGTELTGGSSARPVPTDPSLCPFAFRDENAPFLQVQAGGGQLKQLTAEPWPALTTISVVNCSEHFQMGLQLAAGARAPERTLTGGV